MQMRSSPISLAFFFLPKGSFKDPGNKGLDILELTLINGPREQNYYAINYLKDEQGRRQQHKNCRLHL